MNLMDCKKSNKTVLRKVDTTRYLINRISKRQATFFGHVMRREKLKHLVTSAIIERKRRSGKQHEKN